MNNKYTYGYFSKHRTRQERWDSYDKKYGEDSSLKVFIFLVGLLGATLLVYALTA